MICDSCDRTSNCKMKFEGIGPFCVFHLPKKEDDDCLGPLKQIFGIK